MLSPVIWENLSKEAKLQVLQRPSKQNQPDLVDKVRSIVERVRRQGDAACREMSRQFDHVDITDFAVKAEDFIAARTQVSSSTQRAIRQAIDNLTTFHALQKSIGIQVETAAGVFCETQARPISRVGLYVPGGSAPLVSTVLMLGVPAKIANCPVR